MTIWKKIWPPMVPLIVIFIALEWLTKNGSIPSYILPAPSEIFQSFRDDFEQYILALRQTLSAAVLGLLLSIVVGVTSALLLSTSKLVERSLYPYTVFFQTVPIISIAPLLVIWFGFGLNTVIVSAFIVSLFPIIANTLAGLRSAPLPLVDLFSLYNASASDILFKLRLPAAVPQIVTGIRVASGLAMIGAIVGEFIAGGGLGGLIDMARTQQRLDKVFASILIASFLGIFIVTLLNFIFKYALRRWRDLI